MENIQSCEISSSHGGEYEVQICPLGCTALMMERARTSETSVDNYFTRQYIPGDKSEHSISLHTSWPQHFDTDKCSLINFIDGADTYYRPPLWSSG
jgi:hypothetical protein